jgi:galactokinase
VTSGSCIIALAQRSKLRQIKKALDKADGNTFYAEKADEGVRIEK